MSKMKNAAPASDASASNPFDGFDASQGSRAKINRTWLLFSEEHPYLEPVWVLPARRSNDLRSLFPATLPGQEDTPLYAWAMFLVQPVPASAGILQERQEPVAGRPGDLVFFFEPSALRDVLAAKAAISSPVGIIAGGKKLVHNRKLNRKVQAWQWEIIEHPARLTFPVAPARIIMPSTDAPALALPPARALAEAGADASDQEVAF